ncbi:hypothetical protein ACLOJK_039671 [Asimina triloba]
MSNIHGVGNDQRLWVDDAGDGAFPSADCDVEEPRKNGVCIRSALLQTKQTPASCGFRQRHEFDIVHQGKPCVYFYYADAGAGVGLGAKSVPPDPPLPPIGL